MKNNFIILFCLLSIFSYKSNAQGLREKSANNKFDKYHYRDALDQNLALIKRDSSNLDIQEKIAICYWKLNDSKNAEIWFAKVVKAWKIESEYKLLYAEALAENKKYAEAKKWYLEYAKERPKDSRGDLFANAYSHVNYFYLDSSSYQISIAPFNSDQLDFSPVYCNDGIVFCSNRKTSSLIRNTFAWDNTNYLDLYYLQNGSTKPKRLKGDINSKYHEGPITFNRTKDTAIFTRNNFYKHKLGQDTAGTHKLKLYMAVKRNKKWKVVGGLPFNSNNYSVGHPCFSADYKKLYFVSDAPGGYGGTDIYVVDYHNGIWGKPANLGKNINTEGNEMFPYIDSLNVLYFASDGLPGLGGLDIFSSKLVDTTFQKPVNLGYPINSSRDDFGIAFDKSGNAGYFCSNRKPAGDDDIYKFTIVPKPVPQKLSCVILVMDSISRQQLNSTISIVDDQGGTMPDMKEKDGKFTVDLYPVHTYTITSKSNGYTPKTVSAYKPDNTKPCEILLSLEIKYCISGKIYNVTGEKKIPLDSVTIIIKDTSDKMACIPYMTDSSGKYILCKLKPNTPYTISASRKGYFTKTEPLAFIPYSGMVKDMIPSKIVIGKAIKIENIYFDFDKFDIRPDAAIELDKIVKLLNDNPDIIIELGSHTDCRGTPQYNEWLSDNRAKSSAAYIVSKGIDKNRISGKGYGQTMPVNTCKCAECTDTEHQANRRTEFKVTGFVSGIGRVDVNSAKKNNQ